MINYDFVFIDENDNVLNQNENDYYEYLTDIEELTDFLNTENRVYEEYIEFLELELEEEMDEYEYDYKIS